MTTDNPTQPVDFRALVRGELRRQNVAITDLARSADTPHVTIAKWLRGATGEIGSDRLARLLAALRIDVRPTVVDVERQRLIRRRLTGALAEDRRPKPLSDVSQSATMEE